MHSVTHSACGSSLLGSGQAPSSDIGRRWRGRVPRPASLQRDVRDGAERSRAGGRRRYDRDGTGGVALSGADSSYVASNCVARICSVRGPRACNHPLYIYYTVWWKERTQLISDIIISDSEGSLAKGVLSEVVGTGFVWMEEKYYWCSSAAVVTSSTLARYR